MKLKNKKGFTLIELIVVIAIIGILVLLAVPKFLGHVNKAQLTRIKHDVKIAENVAEEKLTVNSEFPDEWEKTNVDELIQLATENKLYDTKGLVIDEKIEDSNYVIMPKDYINTKLKGNFYANQGGKTYYEDLKSGTINGPDKPNNKTPEEIIIDLENKLPGIKDDVNKLGPGSSNKDILNIERDIDQAEKDIKDAQDKIDKMEDGPDKNKAQEDLNKIKDELENLKEIKNKVKDDILSGEIDKDLKNLDNLIDNLPAEPTEKDLNKIQNEIDRIQNEIDKIEDPIKKKEKQDKLDEIKDKVDSIINPGGIYSDDEIRDKINNGWIPVASASDLDAIRNANGRLYAEGTKWATHATGGMANGKKYIQISNINLKSYQEGEGWNPLGGESQSFQASYDGGGFNIDNLKINRPEKRAVGLFGKLAWDASNIHLRNVDIVGGDWTGAIAGMGPGSITKSSANGIVQGKDEVGGLMGHVADISDSSFKGMVHGNQKIGGLGGTAKSINRSYTEGVVTGNYYVGGIAGTFELIPYGSAYQSSYNNYSIMDVKGLDYVGGIYGTIGEDCSMFNAYYAGKLEGKEYVGLIVGRARHGYQSTRGIKNAIGLIQGNIKVIGYSGMGVYEGNERVSEAMLKLKETFKEWDFNKTWQIEQGKGYPTLQWQHK